MRSGGSAKVDMEVGAAPEEVVKLYEGAMTEKGWHVAMSMAQGGEGGLMLTKAGRKLVVGVKAHGKRSGVCLTLTGK